MIGDVEEPDAARPPPRTAFSAFAHEDDSAGGALLGECDCPLPAWFRPPDFVFDCADWDWRILTDLAPWHGLNVTHAMLDLAFELQTGNIAPGYHVSIHGGAAYVKVREPLSSYHDGFLDMINTVAQLLPLPDCEFVLHAWDHAKVWRQDPVPVFSFVRDAAKTDVTVPYPYTWTVGGLDILPDPACPPWEERAEKVMWRGTCTGPSTGFHEPLWPAYLRYRATVLTRERGDLFDAGLSQACLPPEVAGEPLAHVDTGRGICRHKHILLLDGNAASGRSSLYAHAGSVLLKPDSVFSEWYYHLLRPWVHYVPLREYLEDAPQQAEWLLHRAPPAATKCLRDNLAAFAQRHISTGAVACYWWRLLTAWAKQQPQGSRTEGFSKLML